MIVRTPSRDQLHQLSEWLDEPEHTSEFKEARETYSFEKLKDYCVGIANTGGGRLVFGVSDQKPRIVVGTRAFKNPEKLEGDLCREFGVRFDFEEIAHPEGRVLVLHIPAHPIGRPLAVDGRFLRRAGESLVKMDATEVTRLTQTNLDFTGTICAEASLSDFDPAALHLLRILLQDRSPNLLSSQLSDEQILRDYNLITSAGVTVAALLLLGTPVSLSKHLPQAEVIFEFRSDINAIRHDQRVDYRAGFLLWYKDLWELIDRRNGVQLIQDGFVNKPIRTFTEEVVREAVLNAVCHRDYQIAASTFLKQTLNTLEVVSPGGFPAGITPETVLTRQYPRNRRLAEIFQHCGLIERSGQGVDLMFNTTLREGKERPDYDGSNIHEVRLILRGDIQDPHFVRFLEKVANESGFQFGTQDLIVLDRIARSEEISVEYKSRIEQLVEQGIIERIGRGRGVRLLLSRRFYTYLGRSGLYTAKRGLDRATSKALLLEHIQRCGLTGAALMELQQVLPAASRGTIKTFLGELRSERKVALRGLNRGARWSSNPPI